MRGQRQTAVLNVTRRVENVQIDSVSGRRILVERPAKSGLQWISFQGRIEVAQGNAQLGECDHPAGTMLQGRRWKKSGRSGIVLVQAGRQLIRKVSRV